MVNLNEIAILDIETTGLSIFEDLIVEIGVVTLDIHTGTITPKLDCCIHERGLKDVIQQYEKHEREVWIFDNSTLTPKKALKGYPMVYIRSYLQKLFNHYVFTAYNKDFDFKFLKKRGFSIPKQCECLMYNATYILNIPHPYYGTKYPAFWETWDYYFPDQPEKYNHRALTDAREEAKVAFEMIKREELWLDFEIYEGKA